MAPLEANVYAVQQQQQQHLDYKADSMPCQDNIGFPA
jgi:hypothetical protein